MLDAHWSVLDFRVRCRGALVIGYQVSSVID
jgi:hypothetical protein